MACATPSSSFHAKAHPARCLPPLLHYPDLYLKSPGNLVGKCGPGLGRLPERAEGPTASVCVPRCNRTSAVVAVFSPLLHFLLSIPRHHCSPGPAPDFLTLTKFTSLLDNLRSFPGFPCHRHADGSQTSVSPGIQPPKCPGSFNM